MKSEHNTMQMTLIELAIAIGEQYIAKEEKSSTEEEKYQHENKANQLLEQYKDVFNDYSEID